MQSIRDIFTVFARARKKRNEHTGTRKQLGNQESVQWVLTALVSFHFDPSIARTDASAIRDPRSAIRDPRRAVSTVYLVSTRALVDSFAARRDCRA
jgi:hypothetical protein